MTLTAADVESLATKVFWWELAEYIFAGLVTIACLGEFIAEFTDWFTGGDAGSQKRLEKRATLLLVGALALELVCLVTTNQLSGRLIGSLNELAAAAHGKAQEALEDSNAAMKQSSEATTQAGDADAKARGAITNASEAVRLAHTAKKEAADVESQLRWQGPRWRLLEEGKAVFISELRKFSEQSIVVVDCEPLSRSDPEPYRLEQEILNFIGKEGSGWNIGYKSWTRCGTGGGTSFGGNRIVINSTAGEGVRAAAKALYEVLNKLHISTVNIQTDPNARDQSAAFLGVDSPEVMASDDAKSLYLLIGANPMFDVAGFGKARKTK